MLYLKINQMDKKYKKTISIIELPTMGRNTQIQVFLEDRIINQFILNPSEEFLEGQVSFTIKLIDDIFAKEAYIEKEKSY